MKKFRKLIPAFCMLLIAAMLMGTSTFAWFSMNNRVTVTGMEVTTKVSSNLFVRASTSLNQHVETIDDYLKAATQNLGTGSSAVMLQPVSTVNGVNYFYVDSANNVKANGEVIDSHAYLPYSVSSHADFVEKNGNISGTQPYVDFIYELVAINTSGTDEDLKLTEAVLTYIDDPAVGSDATASEKAFRIAVFMEKFDGSAYTGITTSNLRSIIADTGAAYFDGTAVSTTDAKSPVSSSAQEVTETVTSGSDAKYYQVVVRMWLEGEDTSCKNETYADLSTGAWKLDLAFELGTGASAVTVLSDAYTKTR